LTHFSLCRQPSIGLGMLNTLMLIRYKTKGFYKTKLTLFASIKIAHHFSCSTSKNNLINHKGMKGQSSKNQSQVHTKVIINWQARLLMK
jgi:hypothetical protein